MGATHDTETRDCHGAATHARDLARESAPDIATVLKLLDSLPVDDLEMEARVAIRHARQVAETCGLSPGHKSVARVALARLIVLLERHVTDALS